MGSAVPTPVIENVAISQKITFIQIKNYDE
jgi:hypothetical protein